MGDALMAIFGSPIAQDDHQIRGCDTALDMIGELKSLQRRWEGERKPAINIGIGVNNGLMSVGNMGSSLRFDYTVMGDAVNLGSRLEGLNKEYHTTIIISEYTYEKIKGRFFCRELDCVQVKGKKKPVKIYELIGRDGVPGNLLQGVEYFHQGLGFYRRQEWDRAEEMFREAVRVNPGDKTALLYLDRCKACSISDLPADWDGTFICVTK